MRRVYNLLCIAYGADRRLFADFVSRGYLPKERAEGCEGEYKQVEKAFAKLIKPHIDQRRAKEVLQSQLPASTVKMRKYRQPRQ